MFDLALALRQGFGARGVAVAIVPLAAGAAGLALSPDGTLLYVTTYGAYGPHGKVWVIDASRAEGGRASAPLSLRPPLGASRCGWRYPRTAAPSG